MDAKGGNISFAQEWGPWEAAQAWLDDLYPSSWLSEFENKRAHGTSWGEGSVWKGKEVEGEQRGRFDLYYMQAINFQMIWKRKNI